MVTSVSLPRTDFGTGIRELSYLFLITLALVQIKKSYSVVLSSVFRVSSDILKVKAAGRTYSKCISLI